MVRDAYPTWLTASRLSGISIIAASLIDSEQMKRNLPPIFYEYLFKLTMIAVLVWVLYKPLYILWMAHDLFTPEWFAAGWWEEVQLSDGRIIEIVQKRYYEKAYAGVEGYKSTIVRDAQVVFSLPETGLTEVVWHENLIPMRLDVYQGKPFIVAYPPTRKEFERYGRPKPSYLGFYYEDGQWRRVRYRDIPDSQYDANLVIDRYLPESIKKLTLEVKNSKQFNGRWSISNCYRAVDLKSICNWD
jgi:hypothetical protein